MTALMTDRRPGFRRREDESSAGDARQQSLFGGDGFTTRPPAPSESPPATARAPQPTPTNTAPSVAAPALAPTAVAPAAPAATAVAPPAPAAPPSPTDVAAPAAAPSARPAGAPLARPTLDDAISRAWEGLLIGLPVGCPVCGDELRPTLGGHPRGSCSSCGASID